MADCELGKGDGNSNAACLVLLEANLRTTQKRAWRLGLGFFHV